MRQRICVHLVAVQPIYMHPYTAAKMISTLGLLHGRRVYLNMLAGGFRNDLLALNDPTPHDRRYDRTVEFTNLVRALLEGGPVTFEGEFYTVKNLALTPALAPELFPGILISGSSEAGRKAAKAIQGTAVEYPGPPESCEPDPINMGKQRGLRVGIIAREDEDEAWKVAHERFPSERRGQLMHEMAMKVSDSLWHKKLSEVCEEEPGGERSTYWLVPFKNYKTFCPYLVGSYETVAEELRRYLDVDYRTFILDIPPSEEELHHISVVFSEANRRFAA